MKKTVKIEVPEGMHKLADSRTSHIQRRALYEPLRDLLTAAYLQGAGDMGHALLQRDRVKFPQPEIEYHI